MLYSMMRVYPHMMSNTVGFCSFLSFSARSPGHSCKRPGQMIFPQHAVVQRWIMTDLSGQASRQEQAAQLAEQELHASIIGALSNVFNALYCIDLEQNTFQEILSQGGMHHFMG